MAALFSTWCESLLLFLFPAFSILLSMFLLPSQSPRNEQVQPYHSYLLPAGGTDPTGEAGGGAASILQRQQHQSPVQVPLMASALPKGLEVDLQLYCN